METAVLPPFAQELPPQQQGQAQAHAQASDNLHHDHALSAFTVFSVPSTDTLLNQVARQEHDLCTQRNQLATLQDTMRTVEKERDAARQHTTELNLQLEEMMDYVEEKQATIQQFVLLVTDLNAKVEELSTHERQLHVMQERVRQAVTDKMRADQQLLHMEADEDTLKTLSAEDLRDLHANLTAASARVATRMMEMLEESMHHHVCCVGGCDAPGAFAYLCGHQICNMCYTHLGEHWRHTCPMCRDSSIQLDVTTPIKLF